MDWQTPAALGVVFITLILFLISGRKKKKGCGGDCDCPGKALEPRASRPEVKRPNT